MSTETMQSMINLGVILGILITVITYLERIYIEKSNVIKSIKAELDNLKSWASFESVGWADPPSEAQKFRFVLALNDIIYNMNTAVISISSTFSGIVYFSDKFIAGLALLNQQIQRIKDLKERRNDLLLCKYDLSLSIDEKVKKYRNEKGTGESYKEFRDSLPEEERKFIDLLYGYYFNLHVKNIGTINSGGLKQIFHEVYNEILQKEKDLNNFDYKKLPLYGVVTFLIFMSVVIICNLTTQGSLFSEVLISLLIFIIFYNIKKVKI